MAEPITKAQLIDASQDAETLEQVVNGDNTSNVTSREGRVYPTIAKALYEVIQTGGFEPFQTEAALLASVPNVPKKAAKALDTKKIWYWNGSSWIDTGLSELDRAINYADANPIFKQVKIVAGNDFNNFKTPGVYFHWGANLTSTQVPNAPLYIGSNLAFGVLVVYNAEPTTTNGSITQIFYPYEDGYSAFFRKVSKATGAFPATWDSLITRSVQYTHVEPLTTGVDVLALNPGRYSIPSFAIGNSLVNMPTMPYKYGRIEVDYTTPACKVVRIIPYGRDSLQYVNKNYESDTWSGWKIFKDYDAIKTELDALYASKTALSSAIAGALNNIAQDKYFGKQYTTSELNGTLLFSNAYYYGYNQVTDANGANFNTVKARIYNPQGTPVEYRVFYGSKTNTSSTGISVPQAYTTNPDFSGVCKTFPSSDSGSASEVVLDQVINIPSNTPFVIVFRAQPMTTLRAFYVSAASGNLDSRGFSIWAQPQEWGTFFVANASPNLNFIQAGFQLLLKLPNSGGAPAPVFTPELVLPPKVYALEGLQSNVFLEHTIAIDHTLYDYDVTCAKGAQFARGWRWTPGSSDVAGNYNLTLTCVDKFTGSGLATATTQVVLVNKNANSGVNKKVQVIGDSLVATGSITQGILNNASTDVMGVTLIGTRGIGTNKHEGRGGWTINDYTTVGRTYYAFDVSGITTAPAINSTTYTYNGTEFLVQEVYLTGGSGKIVCNINTGSAPTNGSTGTLTKANASVGDATIAFSNVQSQSGNPFWNAGTTAIDYQNYLTTNSLTAPDVVVIQLGVNDTFGFSSDQAVVDFCATAFPKLDVLINSILAVNASVKVAVCAPPSYASQDAFGTNYQNGQTSRRAKRNITTYNKQLFAYYKGKEASRIYVLSGGINVDAQNNFPESATAVNSRNSKTTITQTNGVHPDTSGYYQESDAITPFIKSLS